ncbi:S1C family serine protease [Microbacterium marinilacus]|uniref:PDZ domain-containing protein n=1 Tax=Microbacterium marinilacus TaxID=415209 RepID=A0ABP7BGB7_9MICO|nr:trypsin-like peptidase domain-containing protein [Microbacterium marinilacus]MBY0688886.1 S1C family serine protease [Microbacterium marinilacus]
MDQQDGQQETARDLPEGGAAAASARSPWYRRRGPIACAAAALVVAGGIAFAVPAAVGASADTTTATADTTPTQDAPSQAAQSRGGGWSAPGQDTGGQGSPTQTFPDQGGSSPSTGDSAASVAEAAAASDEQSTGVVMIETVLGYQQAEAAGTGIVLTSDGLILTNNHVIEGSTEISVTIGTTGETYTASVVGTAASDDVALLQLEGASGLETASIDDDEEAVGDAITAVGNAEGGGVLLAAEGEITALGQTITTTASALSSSATLDGLIEISADVVSGDSGGPVLDAEGEVVGVTTAASSGTATTVAYAIPIDEALGLVDQILSGEDTDTVSIGLPAFLGVQLSDTTAQGASWQPGASQQSTTSGATIAGVVEGTPAAEAGLASGDTITAVDGTAVDGADALRTLLVGYEPGDAVSIDWTDSSGATHSATVTLIEGAAG